MFSQTLNLPPPYIIYNIITINFNNQGSLITGGRGYEDGEHHERYGEEDEPAEVVVAVMEYVAVSEPVYVVIGILIANRVYIIIEIGLYHYSSWGYFLL